MQRAAKKLVPKDHLFRAVKTAYKRTDASAKQINVLR